MPESDEGRRSALASSTKVVSHLVDGAKERQRATQHKRDRSWDAKRSKATYDLPEGLKEAIKEVAEAEDVPAYEIARLFLEYGLAVYQQHEDGLAGLGAEKEVKSREFTLFPQ